MIKIPFKPENFSKEMKPKISGANLSLEYENIESSLIKVGAEISRTLPQALINRLTDKCLAGDASKQEATAIDYLQRAILHFAVYEHLIFLTVRITTDRLKF